MIFSASILRPMACLLLSFILLAQQDQQKQPSPTPAQQEAQQPAAQPPTEEQPASIGILLDSSGSMRAKRDDAVAALQEFVKASNLQDEFFVVNFNNLPYMDQDFTSNTKAIFEAFKRMKARGGTALYDAVFASADHLQKAKYKKRAIIVVTDGEDNSSRWSLQQVLKHLHEPGMPAVYSIGLFSRGEARRARKPLDLLASETGGMALYPENEAQLNEMVRQIAQEIRKR